MHQQAPPIIHRDIKPENLLFFDGILKLADFGSSNRKNKIMKETMCGTPEYLAPEMVLKQGHDEKLDVWAVGVLYYELIFGITPFSTDLRDVKFGENDKEEVMRLLADRILVGIFSTE